MAGSRSRNEKQGLMDAVRRRAVRGVGSVFQRANGVWVAELELGADRMTGRRVRRTFYGKTQREALEKRSAFVRDHEDGLVSAKPGRAQFHTLGEWLDYWLEGKVRDECEPTTYMLYDVAIRLHIKPGLGAVALRELEVDQVEAWLRSMKARGVGLRMRQVALARLRTALNFGLQRRQQTGLRYNAAALGRCRPARRPRCRRRTSSTRARCWTPRAAIGSKRLSRSGSRSASAAVRSSDSSGRTSTWTPAPSRCGAA
jgi:hypothetical protein